MANNMSDQTKNRLLQNPLFGQIREYLMSASETYGIVYVIAPYVQSTVLERLLDGIDAEIVVITSWKPRDIASDASDIESYRICEKSNARLYVNNNIHLKVYSVDFDNAILSTANVSGRGLGIDTDKPSIECATMICDLTDNDRLYLASIQKNSILVDDDVYTWAKIWKSKQQKMPSLIEENEITDYLYKKRAFLISALPMSSSVDDLLRCYHNLENNLIIDDPEKRNCAFHDISNYMLKKGMLDEEFREQLQDAFFTHPFIIKIDEFIEHGAHFGTIKEWIQKNCVDVPVPTRRELTENVQVLLKWFVDLGDGLYVVEVPGKHSERIRKIKK